MGYRLNAERSRHCSRRLTPVVWLMALPAAAWAQSATDTSTAARAPSAATAKASTVQGAPPAKLNLYTSPGQAKDLLSDTRWQNLLAIQPTPEAEASSDSRDWSDAGNPVVKVESERATPVVPGGVGALFWALRHPTQAWRIFAPAR